MERQVQDDLQSIGAKCNNTTYVLISKLVVIPYEALIETLKIKRPTQLIKYKLNYTKLQ